MGADLIINVLAEPADEGFKLDWDAGNTRIDSLSTDDLERVLDETGDLWDLESADEEGGASEDEMREAVREWFKNLKEVIAPDGYPARDVTSIKVRDLWLYISGGMSWGDEPTDSGGIMNRAGYLPEVLEAIGFVTDWDQEVKA